MPNIWIIFSLFTAFLTAAYGFFLQLVDHNIKDNLNLIFIYIRLILIISALISLLSFLIPKYSINKNQIIVMKENINIYILLASAIILFTYQYFVLYALNEGGSLSMVIVGLNLPILIVISSLFLKQKVNVWIWLGLAIYVLLGSWIGVYKTLL